MELFSYFRSTAAYRVRIALNLKGLDYRLTPVNLVNGEQTEQAYLAVNPQGLVPALRLDSGRVITQSTAILEWLEETQAGTRLLPGNAEDRARIRGWVNTIACDIHPLNNLRVLKYLKGILEVSEEHKTDWYYHWIQLGFDVLEQTLSGAPYCAGNSVSLADVYLVPQVFNAHRFGMDMSPYPRIQAIVDACNELDAFAQASPARQPDAPPE